MTLQNKIEINVQKVSGIFSKIPASAISEIVKGIGTSTDPSVVKSVILRVFKKYKIDVKIQAAMMDGIIGSVAAGASLDFVPVNSIKKWYTEKAYSADGIKFSKRINDVSKKTDIINTVRLGITRKNSWRKVAQDLRDKKYQAGDVAKDVQELIDAARQSYAVTGNVAGYGQYKDKIAAVKKRLDKMVDPSTSKLKAAYSELATLTDGASAEAVERAAKYAIFHKQKYNAERIARSEMARAYGQAFQSDIADNDMVIGWRSVLSDAHIEKDICDFHANANLYEMGNGIYPKNHGPVIPYHPHCTCSAEPIYTDEVPDKTPGDFSSKRAVAYLKKLPAAEKVNLLGSDGADRFKKNPNSWQDVLKNYEGQVEQKATIPKGVLYGS